VGFLNSIFGPVIIVAREERITAWYLAGSANDLRRSAVLAGSVHPQISLLLVPSIIHLLPDATGVVVNNGEKDEAVPV
jgi:hypothetical protein